MLIERHVRVSIRFFGTTTSNIVFRTLEGVRIRISEMDQNNEVLSVRMVCRFMWPKVPAGENQNAGSVLSPGSWGIVFHM